MSRTPRSAATSSAWRTRSAALASSGRISDAGPAHASLTQRSAIDAVKHATSRSAERRPPETVRPPCPIAASPGRRAFEGDTPTKVAATILEHEQAPLGALQPRTPPALARLMGKCLSKDSDARWQSALDVADELRWIARPVNTDLVGAAPERTAARMRAAVIAVLLLAAGAAIAWGYTRSSENASLPHWLLLDTRPADGLGSGIDSERLRGFNHPSRTSIALSPDGRWLVFAGRCGFRGTGTMLPSGGGTAANSTTSAGTRPR